MSNILKPNRNIFTNNIKRLNRRIITDAYFNKRGNILDNLLSKTRLQSKQNVTPKLTENVEDEIPTKHILKITGEIVDETFDTALELILDAISTGSNGDIIVLIDSPGGDVASMFSIIDLFNSIPNKIITINMGMAGSCASNLFVLGDKRYMAKHARFLFHSPAIFASDALLNLKHLKDEIKSLDDICAHFENSLSTRTKIPKELIKEGISTSDGVILNSDECIKYGVTDEILTDFKKIII